MALLALVMTLVGWRALMADLGSPLPPGSRVGCALRGAAGQVPAGQRLDRRRAGRGGQLAGRAAEADDGGRAAHGGDERAGRPGRRRPGPAGAAVRPAEGGGTCWCCCCVPVGPGDAAPAAAELADRPGAAAARRSPLEHPVVRPGDRGDDVGVRWLAWLCLGLHLWVLVLDLGATPSSRPGCRRCSATRWPPRSGWSWCSLPAGMGMREVVLVLLLTGPLNKSGRGRRRPAVAVHHHRVGRRRGRGRPGGTTAATTSRPRAGRAPRARSSRRRTRHRAPAVGCRPCRGPLRRTAQLAYCEQMAAMRDEEKRRRKAAKILAVLRHVLGRADAGRPGASSTSAARRASSPTSWPGRERRRRTASTSTCQGWPWRTVAVRRARAVRLRGRRGAAPGRRLGRRRRLQPHLRARRRPGRRDRRRPAGPEAGRRAVPRARQPARRRGAALPAAVPVVPAAGRCRPVRAGVSGARTTTTSSTARGRGCGS